jgi:hypothetical protein
MNSIAENPTVCFCEHDNERSDAIKVRISFTNKVTINFSLKTLQHCTMDLATNQEEV